MSHDFKAFPELTNQQMQFYYFESPHKQIADDFVARIVKVHDGDTVTVEWNERDFTFPIRMANIAAPELGEGGEVAQEWLEGQLLEKEVMVLIDRENRVGKYGRLIGEIILGGININEMAKILGYAEEFA